MQIIGIDCGRHGLKAFAGGKKIFIPSVVGEWRERRISEGGDYETEIDGRQYFVGELAETESRFRREMVCRQKTTEETFVLTMTALALMADRGEQLRVITGLPVEQHTPQIKQEYVRLLSGRHSVRVNSQKHEITLADDSLAVTIEGAGAYWSEVLSGNKKSGRCRVIDLGSRTINALTINGNRFADLDSCTLNYGCLELQNASEQPDDILAEQLARRIYADLSRRWMDLKDEPVLLAGGGALLLEQWMRRHFPRSRVLSDPVYANAIGYYKMGLERWKSK